jgi:Flp pilus assembly protein, pilin Flp
MRKRQALEHLYGQSFFVSVVPGGQVKSKKWVLLSLRDGNKDMTKFVKAFLADNSGAAAAEYALILAIIGSSIAVAALALGNSIGSALNTAGEVIENTNYTPTGG